MSIDAAAPGHAHSGVTFGRARASTAGTMVYVMVVVNLGDTLAGKYRVERVLGRGGMGYVVSATHIQLEQRVAIKILKPELCEDDHEVERFLREARACVRIQSEHVARVLDVGTLDNGGPYMVIELLEGRDLSREIRERKQLPIAEAVDYVLQACEAVAEAHALGIVHRDLKPANLFRSRRSDDSALIKVLDFGIAKALAPEGKAVASILTTTQGLLGSPCYMSPEQVRRPKTVDTRSDIWSLGVILHELMAGCPPFFADTALSILAAVVSDTPPKLRTLREDVPEELEKVVLTCLEKDPKRRYADIIELVKALEPFAPPGACTVSRITAIVRSAKERASDRSSSVPPPDSPVPFDSPKVVRGSEQNTLASAGLDLHTETTHDREVKQTESGLSRSHALPLRSRRWLLIAGIAGAVLVGLVVIAVFAAHSGSRPHVSDDQQSALPRAAGGQAEMAAPAPSTPALLEHRPSPAAPVPDEADRAASTKNVELGASKTRAAKVATEVERTGAAATQGVRTPSVKLAAKSDVVAPASAAASASSAATTTPLVDPLEGRR